MVLPQPPGHLCGLADPSLPPQILTSLLSFVSVVAQLSQVAASQRHFSKMGDLPPPSLWASEKLWLVSL